MKILENISYGLHVEQIMDIFLPEGTDFSVLVQ